MMMNQLFRELSSRLAKSMSVERKSWAEQVVNEGISLKDLLGLLHADAKTSQRFMWLLGDICELAPDLLVPLMPLLFSLRNEMPFPGMRRSVSKWLDLTNVPANIEGQAIPQLLNWTGDSDVSIACRSYSTRTLVKLASSGRINPRKVAKAVESQLKQGTPAFQKRMQQALDRLSAMSDDRSAKQENGGSQG